jgi:hypothetical protein
MCGRSKIVATVRQRKAAEEMAANGGTAASALRKAGYSEVVARNPKRVTSSASWQELMDQYLPEKKLAQVHKKLLGAKYLDHMVFPLTTTDEAIKALITSVGGTAKKIQRGDQGVHVWFWADNTKAQKDAVELGYKIRGRLKADGGKITDPNGKVIALINMEPDGDTQADS